ncbi:FMN-dependent NADH-azoreductase [Vagococcus carniphilus]|uniref:FMN-dependent NADH-azoreductase n=1 Tax=Vagococcus carniphilus TaxID=218144 RepID=UPI00288EF1DB|nr:FMN-dependent NADH-azoreductase [Vagococcus carniphilus]MDT2815129.1 FMN-dependent NADH-azoreductase [Vagococcus carniphilus]MDT2863783.1 FMN-dependent NADH-azoreductase [Vagococcus carniphilus]
MNNVLVIKAHPLTANESRSLTVLDAFINAYKENHSEDAVTIVDIYEEEVPEIDKALFTAWKDAAQEKELTADQIARLTRYNELTEQFLNADKVIIANALWNLGIPSRLKAWIDTVVVNGKTFKYSETGPIGLTSGKKLLHIQSNGGQYGGSDPSSIYIKTIFNFMGVQDVEQIFVEGIDHRPEMGEQIINEAKQKAVTLAKTF